MRVTLEDKHLIFKAQKLKVILLEKKLQLPAAELLISMGPSCRRLLHLPISVNALNNPNLE